MVYSIKSFGIINLTLSSLSLQEALLCVQELNSPQLLFVFVRVGLESTLERSTIAREHMGLLLHQLIKTGTLSRTQYFRGSVLSDTFMLFSLILFQLQSSFSLVLVVLVSVKFEFYF